MKVGDLVRLHPHETMLMGLEDKLRVGLVVGEDATTVPRTLSILWNGCDESDEEYEDGLVLVNAACPCSREGD